MSNKKPPKTAESRAGYSVPANPTTSRSPEESGRIQRGESDDIGMRVKSLVEGKPSASEFARNCGIKESTLRSIIEGATPRADNLIAIADTGGVMVDWLATGRPPKTRAELRALTEAAERSKVSLDPERLRLAIALAEDAASATGQALPSERKADLAMTFYIRLSRGDTQ